VKSRVVIAVEDAEEFQDLVVREESVPYEHTDVATERFHVLGGDTHFHFSGQRL
jgi:hypothetical protein